MREGDRQRLKDGLMSPVYSLEKAESEGNKAEEEPRLLRREKEDKEDKGQASWAGSWAGGISTDSLFVCSGGRSTLQMRFPYKGVVPGQQRKGEAKWSL